MIAATQVLGLLQGLENFLSYRGIEKRAISVQLPVFSELLPNFGNLINCQLWAQQGTKIIRLPEQVQVMQQLFFN